MPIQLTDPIVIPPVHGEGGATYTLARVCGFNWDGDENELVVKMRYGHAPGGVWQSAPDLPPKLIVVRDIPEQVGPNGVEVPADPAYSSFLQTNSALYDAIAAALYSYEPIASLYPGSTL